jgi:hypothetical protein
MFVVVGGWEIQVQSIDSSNLARAGTGYVGGNLWSEIVEYKLLEGLTPEMDMQGSRSVERGM